MKYEFEFSKTVKKFIAKHEEISQRFFDAVKKIAVNDIAFLDIRKLQGTKNEYRLRIGKYRFLYEVFEEKIFIYFYDADSRGDIYK
jgi:mRNA interferase RelE/StbE